MVLGTLMIAACTPSGLYQGVSDLKSSQRKQARTEKRRIFVLYLLLLH
jgi:hypothetical protein